MSDRSYFGLQFIVFALVSASFTNIYVTQPVLPVLQDEFSVEMVLVSFSVSAVMFGIAISNLPFGFLADRLPIHLVAVGGLVWNYRFRISIRTRRLECPTIYFRVTFNHSIKCRH